MNVFNRFLFPPLVLENHTLKLFALFPVDMVTPVEGYDGGVNLRMLQHPLGLMCVIDPYDDPDDPDHPMKEGDKLEVYWDTTLVGEATVRLEDIDHPLYPFLSTAPIVPDSGEVFYELTRVGSNTPERSIALDLRVKLALPGGPDRDPSNPDGHSALQKPGLPPGLDIVDAAWAARGVPLVIENYPNRSARDTIQLQWGSTFVRRVITEDEANGTAPITLLIEQDTILSGGDSNALLVHYQVFDEVWNFSSRYSKKTTVAVDAGAWRLEAPIIQEADEEVIDLELLDKADVTLQIFALKPDFSVNDTLTMTWTGTPSIGSPLINSQSKQITSVPGVVEFKIPNAEIRTIAGGTGDAWYKLDRVNGDLPLSSKHAFARVFGDPSLLPAPTIRELIGDTLEPDQPWAVVQIPAYPGMAYGDWIDMVWLGTSADGHLYPYEDVHPVTAGEVGTVIDMPVSAEHIRALNNGSLDLFYRVSRDDVMLYGVKESDHLAVKVQAIQADLPKPTVLEAPDDVLDYEAVTGPVTLYVDYRGTAAGDVLTYYWLGNPGDGTTSDWVPITTPSAGQPVDFRIKRKFVDANINSIVKIRYVLKRKATGEYSYSEVLELLIGHVLRDLLPPTVLEADANHAIDPSVLPGGANVRVDFIGMVPGDEITLVFEGSADGSTSQTKSVGMPAAPIDYVISQAIVLLNSGLAVNVFYEVRRGGVLLGQSQEFPLTVLGLDWNNFAINGWSPVSFQPITGFDGAFFQRTIKRAVAPVIYTSSRTEVTVNDTGTVTFTRAWTGAATITGRDNAGRSITYTFNAPAKWFLPTTGVSRTRAEAVLYCEQQGLEWPVGNDVAFGTNIRGESRLWSEWGDLRSYGWPLNTGGNGSNWESTFWQGNAYGGWNFQHGNVTSGFWDASNKLGLITWRPNGS